MSWGKLASIAAAIVLIASTWAAWDQIMAKMPFASKDEVIELAADFYPGELARAEQRYFFLLDSYCKLPRGQARQQMGIEINSLWKQVNRYRRKVNMRPLNPPRCR